MATKSRVGKKNELESILVEFFGTPNKAGLITRNTILSELTAVLKNRPMEDMRYELISEEIGKVLRRWEANRVRRFRTGKVKKLIDMQK